MEQTLDTLSLPPPHHVYSLFTFPFLIIFIASTPLPHSLYGLEGAIAWTLSLLNQSMLLLAAMRKLRLTRMPSELVLNELLDSVFEITSPLIPISGFHGI